MLTALAWRNVWRQPRRTVLSLISISFASSAMILLLAVQQGTYAVMWDNTLRVFDGFAQLQPPGYAENRDLADVIPEPRAVIDRLAALESVEVAAPRAATFAVMSRDGRSYAAAVIGVDPSAEVRLSSVTQSMGEGRYLAPGDSNAVVIGAALGRNLRAKVGDSVTVLGSAKDGSVAADVLRVVGIYRDGIPGFDRNVAQIPLPQFQQVFGLDQGANTIALIGPSLSGLERDLPELRRIASEFGLVVRDRADLRPSLDDAIALDIAMSLLWYVSLLVVVIFIILNTLLMSIAERTREFGMLLALGMRATHIGRMLYIELLILTAAGAVMGVILGGAVTTWLADRGIAFDGLETVFSLWGLPGRLYPTLSPSSLLAGPFAIALCLVIAGVLPYLRIRRFTPLAALRAT